MNPVDILIFNALVRRESVNLPGVGSLNVVFRPAVTGSRGNVLNPPMNRVEISKNEVGGGVNIIGLIMNSGGKDEDTSRRIYGKWLEEVTAPDGSIDIESVGGIKSRFLTMAPEISAALNPAGTKSVTVKKQAAGTLIISIIAAVLVGAAIAFAVIAYLESDTREAGAGAEVAGAAGTGVVSSGGAEVAAGTAGEAGSGAAGAGSSTQNEAQAKASIAASAVSPDATQTSPQVATAAGTTLYYVVIGAYSTDHNAERFIAEATSLDGSLSYHKLPLRNGKIMIYTTSHATEAEAAANRRLAAFPQAWVFKYKR